MYKEGKNWKDNSDRKREYSDRNDRGFGERNNRSFGRRNYNSEQNEYSNRRSYKELDQEGNFRERRSNYNADRRNQYSREEGRTSNYGERRTSSFRNDGDDRRREGFSQRREGFAPRRNTSNVRAWDREQEGGRPSYQKRERTADYNPNDKYSKKKQIKYREQFSDPNEPIRLNKYLSRAGVCARREADEYIVAGVVSVNGQVVTELGTKVKRSDVVKFHDEVISLEKKVYILLNKPKNTITTAEDEKGRRTVMDLIAGACTERVTPVGRLDKDTTGVLLFTNDGDLDYKLTHPKYLKKKIYHVQLDKNITKADMMTIASGITLEDGEVSADAISYIDETKKNQVGIEIHSGKNRIVRRIFEHLGYKVEKLDRVYFAGLTKKGLKRGEWRMLTQAEVNFLKMGSF